MDFLKKLRFDYWNFTTFVLLKKLKALLKKLRFEIDESYFLLYNLREVAKRVKGKRSRVVGNKTSIFILTTLPTKTIIAAY